MKSCNRTLALLVLIGSACCASTVRGQYLQPQANPNSASALPPARTQAYSYVPPAPPVGYSPPPAAYYPGGYYNPYGGGYGGYLNGVASVTNANAQYQVTVQQARSAQAQADMAHLDVRRRLKQEAEYDRKMMPNPEEVRLSEMRASLAHSRANPPPTDIWSGVALNDFLMFAETMHRQGLYGPVVPLTPDMLSQINVTTGTTRGSTGALNDGKPLKWTITLRTSPYEDARRKFEAQVAELLKQAGSSQGVDADAILEARQTLRSLDSTLRANVADLTPDEYMGSKRFLNQLGDSLKTLADPNAGNYISKKWSARGNSVGELIEDMNRSGLKFAPAVSGGEPAYSVLYSSMATYDNGLQSLAGPMVRATQPPPRR